MEIHFYKVISIQVFGTFGHWSLSQNRTITKIKSEGYCEIVSDLKFEILVLNLYYHESQK